MPKINRIRIANVPYSGKYILDQMFDSYSGENVLINLANGGGKSVLTQLMMQPILPKQKIHERSMESYLTSKEPTFAMIEWLLDNTSKPTYFLTGIVINKTLGEDNNSRIKYFTFINEYQSANLYDIKNIDFITKENGFMKYKSYDYCLKSLKTQEGKNSKISVFGADERKEYNQTLEEHGIFKDEWKILAEINEKEGGIDDLFDKCKTSDDVIDGWVLKNISKNLENGDALREMFVKLMEEILENETTIKRKEILESFKIDVEKYIEELNKLLEHIGEENELKKNFEENYLKLDAYLKLKENEIAKLNESNEDIQKSLMDIVYEIESEKFHKLNFDFEKQSEKIANLQIELDKKAQNLKRIVQDLRVLEAAKIYGELKNAQSKLIETQAREANLSNDENDEKIKNIQYSLKVKYKKILEMYEKEIDDINNLLSENLKKTNEIDGEVIKTQKEIQEIIANIERTKYEIENFISKEKSLANELGVTFVRNILNELDEKEMQKIKDNYINEEKNIINFIKKIDENITINEQNILDNKNKTVDIENRIDVLIGDLENAKRDFDEYKKQEAEMLKALESIAFDKERLFDKETNLVEIKRQLENTRKRNSENIIYLEKNKEMQSRLKSGELHIDTELGIVLEQNKIKYDTGENYLKSQPDEYKNKLLSRNPLLPYCYILYSKQDYDKVTNITFNQKTGKVIPIILFSNIEKDFKSQNRLVNVEENLMLACFYNDVVFDEELKLKYENELEYSIQELTEKSKNDEERIVKLEYVIKKIQDFIFEKEDEAKLFERKIMIEESLSNSKKEKEAIQKDSEYLYQKTESLKNERNGKEQELKLNDEKRKKFDEFLELDKVYMTNLAKQTKLANERKELDNQINKLTDEKKKLENEKGSKKEQLVQIKNKKQNIENKKIEHDMVETGDILDNDVEELESMYQGMKIKFDGDRQLILNDINESKKVIKEKEHELDKRYKDLLGQYEKEEYSEEKLDFVYDEKENFEKEEEKLRKDFYSANEEKIRIETKLQGATDKIKELGKEDALEPRLIKGNFEERQKELNQNKTKNDMAIKALEKDKISAIHEKNKIERIIEPPVIKEIELNNFDMKMLDIDNLSKQYKQKQKENVMEIKNIEQLYNEISDKNKDVDQTINAILKNMNSITTADNFEKYYFIYERTSDSLKHMNSMLDVLYSTIENIEKDKINIKHQAFIQGRNIYMEMKKISDNSTIKMPGKARKVSLMEIEIPKELDKFAEERVDSYIESCILKLREESKNTEELKGLIEKRIRSWLSDRDLLNKVIDSESIDLKLYKIDINEANSGLKKWKDVIVENSGGEKLISCLILVLALMQYARNKTLEKYGEDGKMESSKILIIDNPFGKMSSTHLLNGLMMILKKFNVQAICLSDISQSSITNQFKLIYQISLKTGIYSNNSYLTLDKVIKSDDLVENTMLESAFVRVKDQMKMF